MCHDMNRYNTADMVFRDEIRLDAGNRLIRFLMDKAPHTDDSTLINVPDEKVIILGDVLCQAGKKPGHMGPEKISNDRSMMQCTVRCVI